MRQKRRRKHKNPTLLTFTQPQNQAQLVFQVLNMQDVWTEFIDKVLYQNYEPNVEDRENLKLIMKRIKEPRRQMTLMKSLMQVSHYNPFTDNVPLKDLSLKDRVLIELIQKDIDEEKEVADRILDAEQQYIINTNNGSYSCLVSEKTDANANRVLFEEGFDIIFLFTKTNEYIISVNPKHKDISLFSFYYQVKSEEPEIWYLHGTKRLAKTQYQQRSSLAAAEIYQYLCNSL